MMTEQIDEVLKVLKENCGSAFSFRGVSMVTYSLTNLGHSKKTLFGYALKGRGKEGGFLEIIGGETVGRNNVLIPTEKLDKLKEFLGTWHVRYEVRNFIEIR
jgi:hypothetical protein